VSSPGLPELIDRVERRIHELQAELKAQRALIEEICEYMPRRNMGKKELYELRKQMAFNARSRGCVDGD